jgi:HD superfamily phosphohydrolase YqeK
MTGLLARLLAWWRGPRRAPVTGLPPWAQVGRRRRAHIQRVADLLEAWAEDMGVSDRERNRWLRAAWLHDALKDARLANGTTHGAAAADRAARDGESDGGVLDAVRYHSLGYARWDQVGRMLYLADNLEPGRRGGRKRRAKLVKRVPRDPEGVLKEIVAQQMHARLENGRPVDPLTLEFWNSVVDP